MRIISANWSTISPHWNCLKTHTFISAQVAHKMTVVSMQSIFFGQIKIITIFHIKFTATHNSKPRPALITKLPLNLIHGQRQIFIAVYMTTENISNKFFSCRSEQHIAAVAIFEPKHFLPIIIVATGFAPQISRLDRWHQHRHVTGPFLLLMYYFFNIFQYFKSQRQPGVNSSSRLLDHSCTQHKPVRYYLRFRRVFF